MTGAGKAIACSAAPARDALSRTEGNDGKAA